MLHNSVNVMVREREEKGTPDYPLFTHDEIDRIVPRLFPHGFNNPKKFSGARDDIEFTFHPAGHIPGAAGVEIIHKHRRIFFTGDVLINVQRILAGAKFPTGKFDTLVTETTHGATEKPPGHERSREMIRLVESINATIQRGGSVLIPVFALGRMQEIMASCTTPGNSTASSTPTSSSPASAWISPTTSTRSPRRPGSSISPAAS